MISIDEKFPREFKLIILIGNIGAGKSTCVKSKPDYVTVCKDCLRYMWGNGKYVYNLRVDNGTQRLTYMKGKLIVEWSTYDGATQ